MLENAITGDRGLVVSEDAGGMLEALGLVTGSSETRGQNAAGPGEWRDRS